MKWGILFVAAMLVDFILAGLLIVWWLERMA